MKSLGIKDGLEQIEVSREEIEKWERKAKDLRKKAFIQYGLENNARGLELIADATRYEVSLDLVRGNRVDLALCKRKKFLIV